MMTNPTVTEKVETEIWTHLFKFNPDVIQQIILLGAIVKVLDIVSLVDVQMIELQETDLVNNTYRVVYADSPVAPLFQRVKDEFPHKTHMQAELVAFKPIPKADKNYDVLFWVGYSHINRAIYYLTLS